MNTKILLLVVGVLLLCIVGMLVRIFFLYSAQKEVPAPEAHLSVSDTNDMQQKYSGKKILYIDSYHEGYEWSDGITEGITDVLSKTDVSLQIHRMDTKRNTDEAFKIAAAEKAKAAIELYKPDVVLVSDDNAFKYLLEPHYKDSDIPIVFSGMNWDVSVYDAPYSNTTGMVEVSLIRELIGMLREYASGDRVGYLNADVLTARKSAGYISKLFEVHFEKEYFVSTMEEWEEAFLALQDEVDVLIFVNNAGIADWDDARAETFARAHTKIPVGTVQEWTMQSSLIGLIKIPQEQGEWSALAALQILDGVPVTSIPMVTNQRGSLLVNIKIADKLNVRIRPDVLKNAEIVE
ncbi:MAG: ABC-type uncharacterized transport system substrate-binding protein [Candidatus Azotimanducaceae bacterium]|jgi:ABC-type uncharacterized transport system substrate-binding protein